MGLWLGVLPAAAQTPAPDAGEASPPASVDVPAPSAPVPSAPPAAAAPKPAVPAPVAPAVIPPRVLVSVPPVYPSSHLAHAEHPTVVLKVTVLTDGSVSDAQVEHSAGDDFDRAALSAVTQWKFEPARSGEQPIASRVGVAVHFELPELGVVDVTAITAAEPMVPHAHEPPLTHEPVPPDGPQFGATARTAATLRNARGASDLQIDRALIEAAPRRDAGDLLSAAPGMVVTRIEGEAVGHRLMLRGFDADHGQDIELTVDGVPINQPSHIHGQGYADLGFVIPETVKGLHVIEGVYDPAQGDFAVAGSANFELGVERRGVQIVSSYGKFDSFRELALWAPEGQSEDTFAAVVFHKTNGFGENRAASSGSAVAQSSFTSGRFKLTLHGSAYGSRALTANVVRRDDVEEGKIGFYDVYPYATTENQNGSATRAQLSAKARYLGEHGENAELTVFFTINDFRLLANYTGFARVSETQPKWTGRGDLIEQLNTNRTLGSKGRYRTRTWQASKWLEGTLELGLYTRLDTIQQAQNLVQAPANTTWDRQIDADIGALDVGGYADLDFDVTRYVALRGGVRADYLHYQVDDRLQNFIPAFRSQDYIPGYRRTAAGLAVGPRVLLEVTPRAGLVLSAAYGEGYRSPQALLLDEGEPAPFTKVRSADVGARVSFGARNPVTLRATGYTTHLQQDIVFDPHEGRASAVGPSTRLGAVLHGDLRLASFLLAAGSVTYVHASLDEPPAATAQDPNPAFTKGQLLPYVPPWVVRLDLTGKRELYDLAKSPIEARARAGYTFWSPRPLPYSQFSNAVSIVDLALGAAWRMVDVEMSIFNLLDPRYAALELSYASNFDPNAVPSRLPARHIMAGSPRTWLLTLGVKL